jgi:two-component system cell cycle sensor histidine kinase/response regulator CckA
VLRNLEPVLKRVAGDDIDVVLPAALPSFDLDVERERVERVLVNVASYARARMPNGGRLRIDLAETIVDRGFIARYPSVRPGAHALITVTEERAMERPGLADALRDESATADSTGVTADRPGVDLSALLRLLADCGGHLWVTAERCGDMSLKIHLPLRVTHAPIETASLVRVDRGAARGKWFRH